MHTTAVIIAAVTLFLAAPASAQIQRNYGTGVFGVTFGGVNAAQRGPRLRNPGTGQRSGGEVNITRFGWKAQTKSMH
jgi:hypothetical protein